ncbi:MAG: patatin-like phospholipase family protein, partial [Acidimicrobiales bacterium]
LVLIHPGGSVELTGSASWLTLRDVRTHHQVRVGSRPDCDRVARSLMGRSVGVVLSGGGPRGFAHLGAIQAIKDAGIPIDVVGGSSIGALMGAGVAFEWGHEATIERVGRALSDRGSLLRPTLPLVSLSSGRRVENILRAPDYLGDRMMEDALVPWFCVSTSLQRALIVVHDRGPAWLAVRSSFALPGILPPVYDHGDLLVDGGVLDNLPVDVMRLRLDGAVVAIDLEPEEDERDNAPFDPSVSGWQVLAKRVNPFARNSAAPSALQVLLRSKQVGVRHLQTSVLAAHPVELYLRPPLAALGALDFRSGEALVEAGYRYTAEVLAATDLSGLLPPAGAERATTG